MKRQKKGGGGDMETGKQEETEKQGGGWGAERGRNVESKV